MNSITHKFTRSEILQAEQDFSDAIKKYFGEVWKIKSDGEYLGCAWDCRSTLAIYGGLWRLLQSVIHKGATRAAGRIEVREAGTVLRFIVFYNKVKEPDRRIIQ